MRIRSGFAKLGKLGLGVLWFWAVLYGLWQGGDAQSLRITLEQGQYVSYSVFCEEVIGS